MRDAKTTQARAEIRMTGAALAYGETERVLCPFCSGGRTHEESFYVTRTETGGSVLYVCHRASCGKRGRLTLTGCTPEPASILKARHHDPFTRPIVRELASYWLRIWDKAVLGPHKCDPHAAGLFANGDWLEEAVWVLRDYNGQRVGVQTRRDGGPRGKYVRTYKETDKTPYHFVHAPDRNAATWIVEDPLSACAVAAWNRNACALLGTYLHPDVREDITYSPTSGFIVALDPGAEAAAGVVKASLACYTTRPVHVLYMNKDFKNMTRDEQHATLVRGRI